MGKKQRHWGYEKSDRLSEIARIDRARALRGKLAPPSAKVEQEPTQTWRNEDGTYMARTKTERNNEIARLVWVEHQTLEEVGVQFALTGARVSQIIWQRRYQHLRDQ